MADKVTLNKDIFSLEVENHELLKIAYDSYLANSRSSHAKTLKRGEVSGGGKKPWKQKGTGRARFGSTRNPIWRHGGVAFGRTGEENFEKKLAKNKFDLDDFMDQMGQVKKMGGLGKILDMIPGAAGKVSEDQLDKGEKEFRSMQAVYDSMTKEERKKPELLNASRRKRIAAGAGVTVTVVNKLISNFEQTRKMMKQMNDPKFMKKLQRGRFKF